MDKGFLKWGVPPSQLYRIFSILGTILPESSGWFGRSIAAMSIRWFGRSCGAMDIYGYIPHISPFKMRSHLYTSPQNQWWHWWPNMGITWYHTVSRYPAEKRWKIPKSIAVVTMNVHLLIHLVYLIIGTSINVVILILLRSILITTRITNNDNHDNDNNITMIILITIRIITITL